VKGIPGFWATVLGRAEMVLNEKDADALTYLTGGCGCEGAWGWWAEQSRGAVVEQLGAAGEGHVWRQDRWVRAVLLVRGGWV
jgi:hypothetical protein